MAVKKTLSAVTSSAALRHRRQSPCNSRCDRVEALLRVNEQLLSGGKGLPQ